MLPGDRWKYLCWCNTLSSTRLLSKQSWHENTHTHGSFNEDHLTTDDVQWWCNMYNEILIIFIRFFSIYSNWVMFNTLNCHKNILTPEIFSLFLYYNHKLQSNLLGFNVIDLHKLVHSWNFLYHYKNFKNVACICIQQLQVNTLYSHLCCKYSHKSFELCL